MIEQQSTSVDAVTGATNSSRVIMNAVQNAVEKAYGDQRASCRCWYVLIVRK